MYRIHRMGRIAREWLPRKRSPAITSRAHAYLQHRSVFLSDLASIKDQHVRLPVQILGMTTFATAYGVCVHAEASDQIPPTLSETLPTSEEAQDTEDIGTDERPSLRTILITVLQDLKDYSPPGILPLCYGVTAINTGITAAFVLASRLKSMSKPRPALSRFMSKNFVLSLLQLRRGRWHVLITSIFTHLDVRHLAVNTLATVVGIFMCCPFLSPKEIAGLYVGTGIIGGVFSVSLRRVFHKEPYILTGGSDSLNALVVFYLCREDREDRSVPPFIYKIMCAGIILGQVVAVAKLMRYGQITSSSGFTDHAAHLAGSLTGVTAYGLKRYSEAMDRGKVGVVEEEHEAT